MKKLCMVLGKGGYTTPITKRQITEGEPFLCSDEEAEKLLSRGFFYEIQDEEKTGVHGLRTVSKNFQLCLPDDWSGMAILIEVPGGIGDALIAASVARYLKQRSCVVAMKPSPLAVPFLKMIEEVDEVSHTLQRDKFNVVLCLADFLKANPHTVYDGCFYYRAFQFLRISNPVLRLPTIDRVSLAPATRALLPKKKPLIVFHTDASATHRCWFDANWRTLFKKLGDNFNKVILGKGDFNKRFGPDIIDASSLAADQQVALCQAADLAICVDSCFLHVAGISGTPTVGLFGPSLKNNCARLYPSVSAVQPECPCGTVYLHPKHCTNGFACQKNLSPEMAYEAIASALGITPPPAPKDKARVTTGGIDDLIRYQRLLIVFPHYLKGGGEVATLEVARQLKGYFDLDVVAFNNYRVRSQETIKHELISEFGATILEDNHIDSDYLSSFDCVLFYGMNESLCIALRSLERRPVTMRVVHTSYPVEGKEFTETWSTVIDKTLCVNPSICEQIPGSSPVVNPVTLSKLQGAPHKFFSGDRPTLGFIGRFDSNKRIAWLVRAMRDLDANLLIQGLDSDSLTRGALQRIAYESGCSEKVVFVDPSDNVGTTLRSCDALCLLSEAEALPMVVLEAGWVGTPVIATKVGALPSLFSKEVTFVKFTGKGQDCKTSLKRIVARMKRGEFPLPGRVSAMQKKVQGMCSPEAVGAIYCKELRSLFANSLSLPQTIRLSREQGIGDVVMATAVLHKIKESINTPISFHTSQVMEKSIRATFPDIEVVTGKVDRKEYKYLDYNSCWEKEQHIVEGMGGSKKDVQLWIPKRTKRHRGRAKTIGIMPYSNAGAQFRSKELPFSVLQEFVSRLSEKFQCFQLGHSSEVLLNDVGDERSNSVEELIDSFSRMRRVVAVEGLANHIGYLLRKPSMIIVGGSSSEEISSYDLHHHTKTPDPCRCWASILTRNVGKPCRGYPREAPCMKAFTVDSLMEEFQKYYMSSE